MNDPDHPVWKIVKLLVLLGFMIFLSYVNASNFDQTEWTFITQMIVIMFGAEGLQEIIKTWKKKNEQDSGT